MPMKRINSQFILARYFYTKGSHKSRGLLVNHRLLCATTLNHTKIKGLNRRSMCNVSLSSMG